MHNLKANKSEMIDIQAQVDKKADRTEIRTALEDIQHEIYDNLDKKADSSEVHGILANKPDMATLHKYLGSKLDEIVDNRSRIDALVDDMHSRAQRFELE